MRPQHSKPSSVICRIDVSAFASVLLVLFALFMAPFGILRGFPREAWSATVEYPHASHAVNMRRALREDALVVAIERDGRIWLDNGRIEAAGLTPAIRERLNKGAEQKVYIRADQRAKYGTVVKVLNSIRSAGVESIAFIVWERASQRMPPPGRPSARAQ